MIITVIISSFSMLFTVEFWRYSTITMIPFIGFYTLAKWLMVTKFSLLSNGWFNICYPIGAVITIIPVVMIIIFNNPLARLIAEKDSEPLLGLILNGVAYLYLNIFIAIAGYSLFKIINILRSVKA